MALDSGYWEVSNPIMTVGDHIRAMTDEELANIILCPLGFRMFKCSVEGVKCVDCKLEWLKQPVGGNEND